MDFSKVLSFMKKGKDVIDVLSSDDSSNDSSEKAKPVKLSENMSKEDEDKFIDQQISSLNSPSDVLTAIKTIAEQAQETIKFCEVQKTKREMIRQQARVEIAKIDAISNLVKTYLDKTFDERKYLFEEHFKRVDMAIESGNSELLAMELQSINQLAVSSPFKALSDMGSVRNLLNNHEELDI